VIKLKHALALVWKVSGLRIPDPSGFLQRLSWCDCPVLVPPSMPSGHSRPRETLVAECEEPKAVAQLRRWLPNRVGPTMPFVPRGSQATYLRGRGAAPLSGRDGQRPIREETPSTEPSLSGSGLEDSFGSLGGQRGADVFGP